MRPKISRRHFISSASVLAAGASFYRMKYASDKTSDGKKGGDIVSIVRVKNGNINKAVEEAIDLLGGMRSLTAGKERIILKPNLVGDSVN